MGDDKARELGLEPIAFVRQWAVAGVEPDIMGIGPVKAVPKLLAKTGLSLDDIDLVEINEAFASQSVYCQRELGIPDEKLNVNGGAIALGHPVGATGSRLIVTALHELERRDASLAFVTMCCGSALGTGTIIERL